MAVIGDHCRVPVQIGRVGEWKGAYWLLACMPLERLA